MRIVIHLGHCLSFRFSSFVSQLMLHDCLTTIDQMPCSASQDSRVETPSMLAAVRTEMTAMSGLPSRRVYSCHLQFCFGTLAI